MSTPEILSALTTPFDESGALDLETFTHRVQAANSALDGVFVAGTTGEFLALDEDERVQLAAAALEVCGPTRAVIHVGAPSTRQALRLTERIAALGATRFAAVTPYYLASTPAGISRHWAAIQRECGGDLYGYVFPDVATTDLQPAELEQVLDSGIAGLKVSGTASTRVADYVAHAPEGFRIFSGNDAALPDTMRDGGVGTVSGVSGAAPTLWSSLRDAMIADDAAAIERAQQAIGQLVPLLGPSIANIKYAHQLLTDDTGVCRMAIDAPSAATRSAIQGTVDSLGLTDGAAA